MPVSRAKKLLNEIDDKRKEMYQSSKQKDIGNALQVITDHGFDVGKWEAGWGWWITKPDGTLVQDVKSHAGLMRFAKSLQQK